MSGALAEQQDHQVEIPRGELPAHVREDHEHPL
jgi:hypothetical protein